MDITTTQFVRHFGVLARQFPSHGDLQAFLDHCTLSLYPAGKSLISYGGECSTLYLVWSGLLSASIEDGQTRLVLGDIRPGEWVGEVTLIEPGRATASVTCVEDSYLLAFSHKSFETLRASHPAAAGALLQGLCLSIAHRLRASSERIAEQIGDGEYRLLEIPSADKASVIGFITRLLSLLLGTHSVK
jgi:CRP-like cAMP-binding protein